MQGARRDCDVSNSLGTTKGPGGRRQVLLDSALAAGHHLAVVKMPVEAKIGRRPGLSSNVCVGAVNKTLNIPAHSFKPSFHSRLSCITNG